MGAAGGWQAAASLPCACFLRCCSFTPFPTHTKRLVARAEESEKVPSELEAPFQGLLWHQTHLMAESQSRDKQYDPRTNPQHHCTALLHQLLKLLAQYLDQTEVVLDGHKLRALDYDALQNTLRRWDTCFQLDLARFDPKAVIAPHGLNLAILRTKLARVQVIRETNFLLMSYSLFDCVLAFILVLLVTTPYPASELSGYVMCSFFTYLFVYLRLKVRSLDNPFVYEGGPNQQMLRTGRVAPQRLCEISFDVLFCNLARQLEAYLPKDYLAAHRAQENDDVGAYLTAIEAVAEAEAAKARAKAVAEKEKKAVAAEGERAAAAAAGAAGGAAGAVAPAGSAAPAAAASSSESAVQEQQQQQQQQQQRRPSDALETVVLVRPPTQGARLRVKGQGEE